MDAWGWEQLRPWLAARVELPIGPLFCVIDGRTRGRPWSERCGAQRAPSLHSATVRGSVGSPALLLADSWYQNVDGLKWTTPPSLAHFIRRGDAHGVMNSAQTSSTPAPW